MPSKLLTRSRSLFMAVLIAVFSPSLFAADVNDDSTRYQQFRDTVIGYVRADAEAYLAAKPAPAFPVPVLDHRGRWNTEVSVYLDGMLRGTGQARAEYLSQSLHAATVSALTGTTMMVPAQLSRARFKVSFDYPPNRVASIIDYHGKGYELLGDVVAVRTLNRSLIEQQLERAKHYLLTIMDPRLHGFPKSYDAATDTPENRLRTIYTASSLYTLLKMDAWKKDPAIEKQIKPIAGYLLSMQCMKGPCRGAFHYSYFLDQQQREQRFVVGTASKTIFTLIDLWHQTHDKRYLESAKLAANWLVSMVNTDGSVNPVLELKDGKWHKETRFSFLYSGQVLSALSRLYVVSPDEHYRKAADRIATLFRNKMQQNGGKVLGDEYREANSVSTSWVAKAVYDYSRIDKNPDNHKVVFQAMDAVLTHLVNAPYDPYYDGSIYDDPSSSGTGWVNEVLIDVNQLCREDGRSDCDRYRDAMVHITRWLIQRSYVGPNTYAIRNPQRALGGSIRNYGETIVRTDAVCHGNNSLIGLLEIAGDRIDLELKPRPFDQFYRALRLSVEHD